MRTKMQLTNTNREEISYIIEQGNEKTVVTRGDEMRKRSGKALQQDWSEGGRRREESIIIKKTKHPLQDWITSSRQEGAFEKREGGD